MVGCQRQDEEEREISGTQVHSSKQNLNFDFLCIEHIEISDTFSAAPY